MPDPDVVIRQRLRQDLTAEHLPANFLAAAEDHANGHRRRRRLARLGGVAATIGAIAVAAASLWPAGPSQSTPPPVLAEGFADPTIASRVAEGVLQDGTSWRLDVALPEAWPQADGAPGDLCFQLTQTDSDNARTDFHACHGLGEHSVAPLGGGLFVLPNADSASRLDVVTGGRTVSRPVRILRHGRFPVSFATADMSGIEDRAVEGLTLRDADERELWSVGRRAEE